MTEWVQYEDTTIEVTRDGRYRSNGVERVLSTNTRGYRQVKLKGKSLMLHQIIARVFIPNPDGKLQIDHIDGNQLNNSVHNLRWATSSENIRNRIFTKKKSGLPRGVYCTKDKKKYVCSIQFNGKNEHLGTYDTAEEASAVYEARAREAFGEFYRPIVLPVQEIV